VDGRWVFLDRVHRSSPRTVVWTGLPRDAQCERIGWTMTARSGDARPRGSSSTAWAQWRAAYESRRYWELPWFDPGPSPQVREAVRRGFWSAGSAVLDVGCGAGSNVLFLARKGFEVHGIDLSPGAVRAANERATKAHLPVDVREGDGLAIPFSRGRFSGAMDNGCFHTIPIGRRADYAREVARVVRPGGGFLLAWVAREYVDPRGPPHRPSVEEVARSLERHFLFTRTEFRPASEANGLPAYVAWLVRRKSPQPAPR